ncbi:hypothetical protein [Streptomyces sp. 5-10]|uniref:hypothetical protein n=1 Tax=Streptomyces sp. 5-10 TaxID=878925 RepID=UPI00168A7012|nr:hypothetical protein [Streptomyces sp. 5-10]MBD3004787.1 hypothetical protein [Streptomyces sp. 5-10]
MMDTVKVASDPASLTRSETTGTFRVKFQDGKLKSAEAVHVTPEEAEEPPEDPSGPAEDPDGIGGVSEASSTVADSETATLKTPQNDVETDVVEIQAQTPGGYRVQYTDAAHRQMEGLDPELCNRVDGAIQAVAAISPRNRSSQVGDMADRRRVKAEGMLVTFWLSEPMSMMRILTVIDVTHEAETLNTAKEEPTPVVPLASKSLPYVHFIDDPEESGRRLQTPLAS